MLTVEQVVALAPDVTSMKAGQGLAVTSSWTSLGRDAVLLWGDCRGSGKLPYRVTIEHASTAYTCTCPSHKFPCKHVLGLLLLAATGAVPEGRPPERALAWFVRREQKRKSERRVAAPPSADSPSDDAREAAARKRAAARDANVAAGLDEMERWLFDVARLGVASVEREPAAFWHAKAARLVDAQAPGLARRVRAIAEIAASGRDVAPRTVASLGALFGLREAFARLDTLPEALRVDVRRHVGYTQREDEAVLRPGAIVDDRWTLIGARSEDEDRVVAHRAWLFGERTQSYALVLQFVVPGASAAPLAVAVPAGGVFTARVAYFESSVPQRVVVVERGPAETAQTFPAGESAREILDAYARDVARDPWFALAPARAAVAAIVRRGETWFAADVAGDALPLATGGFDPFVVQALCGNRAMTLYGEWNGRAFAPLAAVAGGRFVRLT